MKKLAEEHPDEVDISWEDETYVTGHVPVNWVKINPPRVYTEEQKAEMAERMRRLREDT